MLAHDKNKKAEKPTLSTYRDGVIRGCEAARISTNPSIQKHTHNILYRHTKRYHRSGRWYYAYSRGFVDGYFLACLNRRC